MLPDAKMKLGATVKSYINFVTLRNWQLKIFVYKTYHLINRG